MKLKKKNINIKILFYIFGMIFVWFVIHTLIITADGLKDELGTSDAAVVLGNKVELSGKPSKRLQGRLDKTAELYEKNYFEYIIVSGGTGKEGFDEAAVMKEYLAEKGIPDDKILLDSNGYNSYMTAKNTKAIMDEMGFDSIMIITQFYHISRTKLAFDKMGVENVYSTHAEYLDIRDVYSVVREFFAYYKYLFL